MTNTSSYKVLSCDISWVDPSREEEAYEFIYGHKKMYHNIWQLPTEYLNPALIDMMQSIGVPAIKGYFFRTPAHSKSHIHIDGGSFHDKWAINWAWGSEDHLMKWYKVKQEASQNQYNSTGAGTNYLQFRSDMVEVIDSVQIDMSHPVLCRVGIPHRVENYTKFPRWSVSIRDADIDKPTERDWNWILQKLS